MDALQGLGGALAGAFVSALRVQLQEMDLTAPARLVYSEEALAAELGITVRTLYEWAAAGTGPKYVRAGKVRLYRVADVAAWLAACPAFTSTADESESRRREKKARAA